ncbi:hypothetical protein [Bacillus sp. FJAT-50079]|uniref:hypothetical protein n=1 Tax=Bacillus sp. FJAT-50079 TaxID=2833577 RepID=UPI001BC8D12C|nr:hypothetical protein [Bacillus sp. FJAT-50079]MBS4209289.1 hypothetical protein [Bacillus sp. FJAT-50079]
MKPFIGLLKKEICISRFWYVTYLILIFIAISLGSYFSKRLDEPSMVIPLLIMLILPIHLFFMPVTVYSLLKIEGKTQLWLYNPQSSAKLLLAKITTALLFQIISQVFVSTYGLLLVKLLIYKDIPLPVHAVMLTNIVLLVIGLYTTVWVIFLWTVYHSLERVQVIKKFRWLILFVIFIACNIVETFVSKLKFVRDYLFAWELDITTSYAVSYESGIGWTFDTMSAPLPVIPLIIYAMIALGLFFIACKLLDQKVEV